MTTLEERVDRLEREMQVLRHEVDASRGSNAAAIDLVHGDTQAIRAELTEFRTETGNRFDRVEATMAEILRRLPE